MKTKTMISSALLVALLSWGTWAGEESHGDAKNVTITDVKETLFSSDKEWNAITDFLKSAIKEFSDMKKSEIVNISSSEDCPVHQEFVETISDVEKQLQSIEAKAQEGTGLFVLVGNPQKERIQKRIAEGKAILNQLKNTEFFQGISFYAKERCKH